MTRNTYDEVMKIPRTVSVPEETWALVDQAVARGEAPSVSAFVADALGAATEATTLREFLDDWFAETGAPSEASLRQARQDLGISR